MQNHHFEATELHSGPHHNDTEDAIPSPLARKLNPIRTISTEPRPHPQLIASTQAPTPD